MKLAKRGIAFVVLIVMVAVIGMILNTVTGHSGSNKSFLAPLVVALVMVFYFYRGDKKKGGVSRETFHRNSDD